MSVEIPNHATILMELAKAVKMHNFYPQGHPHLESMIEKSYQQIKQCLNAAGEIKWHIDHRGLYEGKSLIAPGNAEIAGFAKKLFFRRIKALAFTPVLSARDIKMFLSAVNTEPEALQARGGIEAVFASLDINGILPNEQRYEDIKRLKAELEKEKEDEKSFSEDAGKPPGDSARASEEDKTRPREEIQDDPLYALVDKIRKERDGLRYNDLSVRINEKLGPLLIEGKLDEVFPVLITFYQHSLASSGRSDGIRGAALERLKGLLTRDVLNHLAQRLAVKDEPLRHAVQSVLLSAGDEAAEALLDAIVNATQATARRHIFNALVLFGERLRPLAEARLQHPEWYVARQMVSLLGEVGGPDALPALEAAYGNPEPKVKKEVLKSMVKIGTPRVTRFLLTVLKEEDQSIVAQAIISLGIIKDPSAISSLADIAVRREAFSEAQETSKEAVKALGMIGDSGAVPYLERILSRKVWFGKKANDEVRSLAAYSLGMIGTPEAVAAVEAAFATSTGELKMACKRVLDARERTT